MKKLLLVDDSSTIRDEVCAAITAIGDFQVLQAENGIKGLEEYESNKDISLICLDVNMPEMDGITMLKTLKSQYEVSDLPSIVMLTTEASGDLKKEAKDNGARAWLLKPFNQEKIRKVLEKLL